MRDRVALAYAAAAALLVAPIVGAGLLEVPKFFDPCRRWGGERGVSVEIPREGPCAGGVSGTSETRVEAAARLALVQGGLAFAAGLGLWGAWRGRAAAMVTGAILLFALAVPLSLSLFGVPPGVASALLLLGAREVRPFPRDARIAARALGTVAGAALLWIGGQWAQGILREGLTWLAVPFVVLYLGTLLALALAGWWPLRGARATS